MENPIEPLPFANASPVVPAMPIPVCLNPYCKGFSTKASIHCSVGPHRVKEGGRRVRVKGCNAKEISRDFQKFSIVTLFVTLS